MRVLLTSDDGGHAPGLRALADVVGRAHPDAVCLAPVAECGDFGTSLRRDGGWAARVADLAGDDRSDLLRLPATPALLVRAACDGMFGPAPDLVLVGINYGPNVGRGVLHSGTVGAVLTAANLGMRAAAVSLDDVHSTRGLEDGYMHWDAAAAVALPLLSWLAEQVSAAALSVNVPNRPLESIESVRPARLASAPADVGRTDTDISLLTAGDITVTALASLDGHVADASAAARALDDHLQESRRGAARPEPTGHQSRRDP